MRFIDTLPAGALTLANTDDVTAHAAALQQAPAVVLQFPKWTDGRAYSQAALLRGRLGFGGEICATGEVVVDMLPLLQRCGFDAVQLADDQNRASAERALAFIPSHYQGDVREPRPLFARLAESAA